jgi:8-oxo-dGTP pyrophosphatase MutT (NUDIX family)
MTIQPPFLQQLKRQFSSHTPEILELDRPRAGVLVPLVIEPEPSVLLTVRAAHLNSHPGQVSFPGGMFEPEDLSLTHTALRETHEEIALQPNLFEVVGELSTAFSKDGVQVYPIVGVIENSSSAIASPDEIAEIFSVPWQFFVEQAPKMEPIERHGLKFQIPHYHYEGKHIWGLTAMILLELINLVEGTKWPTPQFSAAMHPGEDR